jgi:hypothetical protein
MAFTIGRIRRTARSLEVPNSFFATQVNMWCGRERSRSPRNVHAWLRNYWEILGEYGRRAGVVSQAVEAPPA